MKSSKIETSDIVAEMERAGVKKNSRSWEEYERGKKAVAPIVGGGMKYMSKGVQRVIAEYVGV